jgi:hypothetical protein
MTDNTLSISCSNCNKEYTSDIPNSPKIYKCKKCNETIVVYPKIREIRLEKVEPNLEINSKDYSKAYIDIRINNIRFKLAEKYDENKITSAKFEKTNFITRKIYAPEKGDVVYWNKNGKIKFFNDQLFIFPSLDYKTTSNLWATTIILYFNSDKLRKLMFQVWSDNKSSHNIIAIFHEVLDCFAGIFGLPQSDEDINNIFWTFKDSVFGCKISPDSVAAWFSWVL